MVEVVRRYGRLWWLFLLNSLAVELEYRAAMISESVLALSRLGWQLAGIWVFFVHRERIGTWTLWEAAVVLGLFIFFDGLIEAFFRPNMEAIIEHIRTGTLDFVLLKPVDAQFLATVRWVRFRHFGDMLAGMGLIAYALLRLRRTPPLWGLVSLWALMLAAAVILYSILLVLVTLAFWFVDVTNIIELVWSVYEAGRVPVDAFPDVVRVVLTFIIPIAFITTVPAEALLGRVTPTFASLSLFMATISLAISTGFWRYALRHYTSASS
ncbi:MAG: hypothetical protein GXO55_10495 [Chloroflexi bacterium]|nr:hypothetical protein [Chloroflexota bacterium]